MYDLATTDGYNLAQFKKDYLAIGNAMCRLCIKAYQLAEKDAKTFKQFVIEELGLSRQTAERMISVGMIYSDNPGLSDLGYTKAAELLPIKEQIGEFREKQELTDDEITAMSMREIRESVKCYLAAGRMPDEIEDQPLTATEKYYMATAEYLHNDLRAGKVISKADRELIIKLSDELLKLVERRKHATR